jgi:succinyl-CoA synthetase beta subunit/citryl-CoA synthetase large subunit
MRLLENEAKAWLQKRGLPVPEASVVSSPEEVARQVELLGGRAAVKALIPAGRRGKAGAVRLVQSPDEARIAAGAILGREISGFKVDQLFIERRIQVARELYLSFAFDGLGPKVMASTSGGVDVEETFEAAPGHIAHRSIDPCLGLRSWEAIDLWDLAGLDAALLPTIAGLTVRLYEAFRQADALMLEINPLVIDDTGERWLVGAMMEIDDQALFRQPDWSERSEGASGEEKPNEREQQVILADRIFPGGAIRYTELDGDIGLLVAGGGAGLLQHDMIVAAGGRPANHSDISPTPSPEKPAAIIGAIFANPRTRALLIGYNFLQMARCDTVIRGLLIAIERHGIDPEKFPIVIRLFGPGEDEARALVSSVTGIQYLPHGASLEEGVAAVLAVAASAKSQARAR